MPRFRKKPVVIEAIRNTAENYLDGSFAAFLGDAGRSTRETLPPYYVIHTLEGDMTCAPGDWVVKGVAGEFYPVKGEIFQATYEPAE